jgi:outer membrane protein
MKQTLLILNFLLVAAVVYLYYLHYSYTNADRHQLENNKAAVLNSFKIAYFELDSLESNYEYAKEIKAYLTKKDQGNVNQLNKLKNEYLNKLKEYQQKGASLSQNEQSEYQQALMKLQTNYQETEQNLNTEMQTEAAEKMQGVKMKIQDFLKTYCASKGLAYVFASNENDFIYYKDTVRNITPDIVRGLNEQYKNPAIK